MTLKILSLNVCSLHDKVKRRAIFNYCRARADIICLQEAYSCLDTANGWQLGWGNEIYFCHRTNKACGVSIMIKRGVDAKIIKSTGDQEGWHLVCLVQQDNNLFQIQNIYAPNIDNPKFFSDVITTTIESEYKSIIVGDFNMVIDCKLDRSGKNPTQSKNEKAAEVLRQIMQDVVFSDVWRDRNPGVKRWSYIRKNPFAASRIDCALVFQGLVQNIVSTFYISSTHTDHSAYFTAISFTEQVRGPGFWKLNNSLLTELEYVQRMNQHLRQKET